ncbi:LysM peptidoglycan-binding domain-containing protein [bacterium]|nr:LysM peptidoglycan-binding domain-containing protein [bacterium]
MKKSFKSRLVAGLLIASFGSVGAYVVRDGDTLWDLGEYHLQNPFAWTQIWEKNPQVENPDLIYPGQEITIDGVEAGKPAKKAGSAQMAPSLDDVERTSQEDDAGIKIIQNMKNKNSLKDEFKDKLGGLKPGNTENFSAGPTKEYSYRDTLEQKFVLSKFFQLNAPVLELYTNKLDSNSYTPQFDQKKSFQNTVVMANSQLIIEAGTNEGFNEGDLVEVYSPYNDTVVINRGDKELTFRVEKTIAIAKVYMTTKSKSRLLVVKSWDGKNIDGLRIRKWQQRHLTEVESYETVEKPDFQNAATISMIKKKGIQVQIHDWLLLDKGLVQGFKTGDVVLVFEGDAIVLDENEDISDSLKQEKQKDQFARRIIASGIIMRDTPQSSSVLLTTLPNGGEINPSANDKVVVIQKAK